MGPLIGLGVAFAFCLVYVGIMGARETRKEEEEKKNRKTSKILFNATIQEARYTPEEVFETLYGKDAEPNFFKKATNK